MVKSIGKAYVPKQKILQTWSKFGSNYIWSHLSQWKYWIYAKCTKVPFFIYEPTLNKLLSLQIFVAVCWIFKTYIVSIFIKKEILKAHLMSTLSVSTLAKQFIGENYSFPVLLLKWIQNCHDNTWTVEPSGQLNFAIKSVDSLYCQLCKGKTQLFKKFRLSWLF